MKQKQFNSAAFEKDLHELFFKYEIKQGIFVTTNVNDDGEDTIVTAVKHPDQLVEPHYMAAVSNLFCMIGIDIENMEGVKNILQDYKEKLEAREREKFREEEARIMAEQIAKLSAEDQALLTEYREEKTAYVRKQDYENAAKFRNLERELLDKAKAISNG